MGLLQAIFGAKPAYGTPPFAPPHPQTGGATDPAMPGEQQHGISGFLSRAMNPTNGLGQLGQMLLASQDNGIGRMAQMQIQQRGQMDEQRARDMREQQSANQRKFQSLGDGSFGFVDPATGQVTPTYQAPHQATGYGAELDAAGIVGEERSRLLRQHAVNAADPIMTIDDGNGTRFLPRSQVTGAIPGALGMAPPARPSANPPPAAVEFLKANPGQAAAFDEKYGPGASSRLLGGAGSQGPATFSGGISPRVIGAVTGQESGGRVGIQGPQTAWGRAGGLMQVLPSTAKAMAAKLGVPYRPDLMTSKDKTAAPYQQAIGTAYLEEGFARTGNLRDALRYYHGGPSRTMWGPKTNRYADEVMARIGGRG